MRFRSILGGLALPVVICACSGDDNASPVPPADAATTDSGKDSGSDAHVDGPVAEGGAADSAAPDSGADGSPSDAADAASADAGDAALADAGDAASANAGDAALADAGDATLGDSGNSLLGDAGDSGALLGEAGLLTGQLLPTGDYITPLATSGATLFPLNPGLAGAPTFIADHAAASAVSPDGKTLLVLTSGYNLLVYSSGPNEGYGIPGLNGEWIFVFDISGGAAVQKQVLAIPNSFAGIAFNPSGQEFYVSGGKDDNVHVFDLTNGTWAEATVSTDAGPAAATIALGHSSGLGIKVGPQAGGLAVNATGSTLVVANYENDSLSLVDIASKAIREIDLRPGKAATSPQPGVAGGEFPFGVVVKGNATAYVSSQRDREIDVVDLTAPAVVKRIPVGGQPNKMILNKDQSRLFVANGNSDSVSVIDTSLNAVIDTIAVAAPAATFPNGAGLKGANPNALALSPDEKTLYVTDGATNAVAVVQLATASTGAETVGLIPTGWYPTSIVTSLDGSVLFVTNAKSEPGPGCLDRVAAALPDAGPDAGPPPYDSCWNGNDYVWTLEKASLLSLPLPPSTALSTLTQQVAKNDHFGASASPDATMAFLRTHIQHVIYIIKENRTYDQILGDLGKGNGDSALTMFPRAYTPNLHALATQYVDLDNFLDTGETSGVGWNWTTAAHSTDAVERNQPINYGKGGLSYDWEGTNRNINVGLATLADRLTALPLTPSDPDLLPGAVDVSAAEGPGGEVGTGYIWDAALRKNLAIRNYGAFVDLGRYALATTDPLFPAMDAAPFTAGHQQAYPANKSLAGNTDVYYRGFDQKYPDLWRYAEWKREFDAYVAGNDLPALELVRLAHDHTGAFSTAIAGVNTPILQVADNDAAVGAVVASVAASPYAGSTLIFIVEDDAQDGPDHVDAHRSTAFVVGPYVKQGALVSTRYDTISMVRTIEEVLGLDPLGIYDALATPMSDVFDTTLDPAAFKYTPVVADALSGTAVLATRDATKVNSYYAALQRGHDARYWERVMRGQDFSREDNLDVARFNRALWKGLMPGAPYPAIRASESAGGDADDAIPWCSATERAHT